MEYIKAILERKKLREEIIKTAYDKHFADLNHKKGRDFKRDEHVELILAINYLHDKGYLDIDKKETEDVVNIRISITSDGIDYYENLLLNRNPDEDGNFDLS